MRIYDKSVAYASSRERILLILGCIALVSGECLMEKRDALENAFLAYTVCDERDITGKSYVVTSVVLGPIFYSVCD